MEKRVIIFRDGVTNQVAIFSNNDIPDRTYLIFPAMGTRASFYNLFAERLSNTGVRVITVDQRGNGGSSIIPSRKIDFGYEDLVQDIRQVSDQIKQWFPNTEVHAIGHSLGGQMASLAAARFPEAMNSLILIASCNVHYKGWPQKDQFKMKYLGRQFYPMARLFGYFPGRYFGIGWREAKSVMRDWCYNLVHGEYRVSNSNYDYEAALKKCNIPLLSFSIENDFLATEAAVKSLVSKFNNTGRHHHNHVNSSMAKVEKLDHFTWAKHPEFFINAITRFNVG